MHSEKAAAMPDVRNAAHQLLPCFEIGPDHDRDFCRMHLVSTSFRARTNRNLEMITSDFRFDASHRPE